MSTPCSLRTVVERRRERGVMWHDPQNLCTIGVDLHSTRWDCGPAADRNDTGGIDFDEVIEGASCDRCGLPVPWTGTELSRFGGNNAVYDTDDGKLHPGDMYWTEHTGRECFHWDNCDGRHLHVILPNGNPWDIDSRASNCDLPKNRTHRCWVREGDPPKVTAGKAGNTCTAGAGSIQSGDYHGFLQGGVLT